MGKQKGQFGFGMKNWEKEWKDMPEFIQEDLMSPKSIIIHFKNKEDMYKFADKIEQKLTTKTKSIWYPKIDPDSFINKEYVDEEE